MTLVFDAEPLVAFFCDEPGSESVGARIRAVEAGERRGLVNAVTCTEVHYVTRTSGERLTDEYLSRIRTWFQVIDADDVWRHAARFKHEHGVALGDAFTLGTAAARDATAYVGADDDFDDVTTVDIERFRDGPA